MGNPPSEDVSPIKKWVDFHCYVSLPEGILWLCEFTTWRIIGGSFRWQAFGPATAHHHSTTCSRACQLLRLSPAFSGSDETTETTGTYRYSTFKLREFVSNLLQKQVVRGTSSFIWDMRILYTVAIMRCFVIFFQKAFWINAAFRFFEFLFGVPSWWEQNAAY